MEPLEEINSKVNEHKLDCSKLLGQKYLADKVTQ